MYLYMDFSQIRYNCTLYRFEELPLGLIASIGKMG